MKTKLNHLMLALAAIALALFCPAPSLAQQQTMTQTTLSSAVTGPSFYSGTGATSALQTTIQLASTTGVVAPVLPGTPSTVLYIGREAMGVFAVNTTTGFVTVTRGYLGTQAAPHPSGDMVLVAPNYAATVAQGGNPIPNGLFSQDPPQNGTCTPAGIPTTPWVNVITGAQWLCSTITNTWIPGFNNPLVSTFNVPNTAVASATTILPTGPLFHLTGTTTVQTITTPVGCDATAVGGCSFTMICDGVCVWNASGNIAVASGTVVAKTTITFIWDAVNSKWYPSSAT